MTYYTSFTHLIFTAIECNLCIYNISFIMLVICKAVSTDLEHLLSSTSTAGLAAVLTIVSAAECRSTSIEDIYPIN
jgi:hypothetical protein